MTQSPGYLRQMKPSLDLAIVNSLTSLTRLQAQALAAVDFHDKLGAHSNRRAQLGRTPNLAEFCLVATRGESRLALWLQRDFRHDASVFSAIDVLELRVQFVGLLDDESTKNSRATLVPASKLELLATYLAITPCPTVSSLSRFAGIHVSRARVWLKRLSQASIIRGHSRPNELFFLNTLLVSRLFRISPDRLNAQFDVTVAKLDWLKRSIYRTTS